MLFFSLPNNYIKTSKWLFYPYSREYIKKCINICLKKNNILNLLNGLLIIIKLI